MDALFHEPQDEEGGFVDTLQESFWLIVGFVCLAFALLALAGCCHCKPTPKPVVIEKKTASRTAPVISPAPKPEPIVLQEVKPK